jgi:aspartyl-tRNA(Asn)/glutamyl-tRNA(Gln) amidotransferase subunit B
MRSKEEAHDYRYFPEPDLPPVVLSDEYIEEIRSTLPELPDARRKRLINEHSLPEYDAGVLTATKQVADFYDATVKCVSA